MYHYGGIYPLSKNRHYAKLMNISHPDSVVKCFFYEFILTLRFVMISFDARESGLVVVPVMYAFFAWLPRFADVLGTEFLSKERYAYGEC